MAVRTKEEILSQLQTILTDNDSDEAIQLIEDVTDSMNDPDPNAVDWEAKYHENDEEWRTRYKNRFFGKSDEEEEEEKEEEEEEEEEITDFKDLFKEE